MNRLILTIIVILLSLLAKESSSVPVYYGDPLAIQKLVMQAVESGFVEVKSLIDKQFWFMLREAKFEKYTFKIKDQMIEYKVNYTSVENLFVIEANLSKYTWRPEIVSSRTYQIVKETQNIDTPLTISVNNNIIKDQTSNQKNDKTTAQSTSKVEQNPKPSQPLFSNLKTQDTPKQLQTQTKPQIQIIDTDKTTSQGGAQHL